MSKKLTITELKKKLKMLDQTDLVDMICDLYKSNEKAKEAINARFMGEEYLLELLKEYKEKMYNIFFPKNLRVLPSLKTAKKLISDFEKNANETMTLDLMLYYVECGTEFTCLFGDINGPFYDSLCNVFGKFVERLNCQSDDSDYQRFQKRVDHLVKKASPIGWGYGCYISDAAMDIIWIEE